LNNLPNELMAKAAELQIEVAGPQIWQYTGSDGKPETRFTLDICIPITEGKGDAGKFQFAELPVFNCVSEIHKGDWNKLGETYQRVIGEMIRKSMFPTGTSREIYSVCDFERPENNITEILIEIQ
jgi:effector-binding domain-containing protein